MLAARSCAGSLLCFLHICVCKRCCMPLLIPWWPERPTRRQRFFLGRNSTRSGPAPVHSDRMAFPRDFQELAEQNSHARMLQALDVIDMLHCLPQQAPGGPPVVAISSPPMAAASTRWLACGCSAPAVTAAPVFARACRRARATLAGQIGAPVRGGANRLQRKRQVWPCPARTPSYVLPGLSLSWRALIVVCGFISSVE
jgi:hypothetical protein